MKSIAALVVLAALLSGCAQWAEAMRKAEAERQERARQCAAQGWVIYKDQCMSPQAAREAERKRESEIAANRRRNHERELACISAGGTWRKDAFDLNDEGNGECQARVRTPSQSLPLSCETYKLGDRVYTDCR